LVIDYAGARAALDSALKEVESALLGKNRPDADKDIRDACTSVFESTTQAYREVLLGCTIARLQDRSIDVTLPYLDQGASAFSGRTLDEKVVNPFLHDSRIPCSRGPYLSVFRRNVRFDGGTRSGLKDKTGYDNLLVLLAYLKGLKKKADFAAFLRYQIFKFLELREAANIPLSRLHRISLEQYRTLIAGLLSTPSGGRFPVFLVEAAFNTIIQFFMLDWTVAVQGINVADSASGQTGDITIRSGDRVVMAAEVTERTVDRNRVVTTFNTKIAPTGIEDYLFFVRLDGLTSDTKRQAQQYFSQGHEVNFVDVGDWILMSLATMGRKGRELFGRALLSLVDADDVPRSLKVAWNAEIAKLVGS